MTRRDAQRLVDLVHKMHNFQPRRGRHVGRGRHVDLDDGTQRGWATALVKSVEIIDETDIANPVPTGEYEIPGLDGYDLDDVEKRRRLSHSERTELDTLRSRNPKRATRFDS